MLEYAMKPQNRGVIPYIYILFYWSFIDEAFARKFMFSNILDLV